MPSRTASRNCSAISARRHVYSIYEERANDATGRQDLFGDVCASLMGTARAESLRTGARITRVDAVSDRGIEQRSARVSGTDRGIGLNQPVEGHAA